MKLKIDFRSYERQFKFPLETACGKWTTRKGIVLRAEDECGQVVYSEIAPLPSHGTETFEEAISFLTKQKINHLPSALEKASAKLPATSSALDYAGQVFVGSIVPQSEELQCTVLFSGGINYEGEVHAILEKGCSSIKCKIGVLSATKEQESMMRLFEKIPDNCNLRLDANGGLSVSDLQSWLSFSESKPIEFIEQPLPVGSEELMSEIGSGFSTPLALDESVSRFEQLKYFEDLWSGFFVVKPSLLGDISGFIKWRDLMSGRLVYSSALESVFGLEMCGQIAGSDSCNAFSLGFGANHSFFSDHLCHPFIDSAVSLGKVSKSYWEGLWARL